MHIWAHAHAGADRQALLIRILAGMGRCWARLSRALSLRCSIDEADDAIAPAMPIFKSDAAPEDIRRRRRWQFKTKTVSCSSVCALCDERGILIADEVQGA